MSSSGVNSQGRQQSHNIDHTPLATSDHDDDDNNGDHEVTIHEQRQEHNDDVLRSNDNSVTKENNWTHQPSMGSFNIGTGTTNSTIITTNRNWINEGIRRVRNEQVRKKMNFLTGMAAIGGFLFGYDTGVISGAMLPIRKYFHLNHTQQEIVVSSTVLAAFGASIVGGTINTKYGRRFAIQLAATIFTIGSFILFIAWDYSILLVGRITVGIGIGIASLTTPIYIAEVATPHMRGKLVTINAFMVTFGQFFAGMIDGILIEAMNEEIGWRFMLGLAAVPSIIMLIGFTFYLPESPRWLCMKSNDTTTALSVLQSVRDTDQDAIDELNDILRSLGKRTLQQQQQLDDNESPNEPEQSTNDETGTSVDYGTTSSTTMNNATTASTSTSSNRLNGTVGIPGDDDGFDGKSFYERFQHMLADIPTRRALMVGCGLMLIQQWSGVNTVMYYAASIYEMSEFDEVTAVWLSGFTALAQVIGVAISIYLVDRVGRRRLVLTSLSLVTLSLIGLGFTFYVARISSEPVKHALGKCKQLPSALVWNGITSYCYDCTNIDGCGYCGGMCVPGTPASPFSVTSCPVDSEWIYQQCHNRYGWFSVFFMVSYLFAFGIGMGGLPWTINSEIYSLKYRSLAVSCSTATNWISNLTVAATFLSISRPTMFTAYGAFWLYSTVALVGLIWLYYSLPETKGLALEDIERLFRGQSPVMGAEYDQVNSADMDDDEDEEDDDDEEEE